MKIKILMVILFSFFFIGCEAKEETEGQIIYRYGDEEMFNPFWNEKVMYNETVVMVKEGEGIPSGRLIFNPTEIISVRDYSLNHEYEVDEYYFEDGVIYLTETSTIPYLTAENLLAKNLPEGFALSFYQAKAKDTNLIYTEGIGIVMHQIAVTYVHDDVWSGPSQEFLGSYLPKTMAILEAGEPLKIVLNGDSISTGANSSGVLGIAPFLDGFGTSFASQLEIRYSSDVELVNTSVGGTLSIWGKEGVDANVNAYTPDLVIIGFGMNDGSWQIQPHIYKENIEFMIKSIQARNPDAEIILISTILANPLSIQSLNQEDYLKELNDLVNEYSGVGVVDMTSFSKELYMTKRGVDILANNINHPSDFLVRCYVMNLLAALIEETD